MAPRQFQSLDNRKLRVRTLLFEDQPIGWILFPIRVRGLMSPVMYGAPYLEIAPTFFAAMVKAGGRLLARNRKLLIPLCRRPARGIPERIASACEHAPEHSQSRNKKNRIMMSPWPTIRSVAQVPVAQTDGFRNG